LSCKFKPIRFQAAEILHGDWWKVGVFQGKAVYSKSLEQVPYRVVAWFDAEEGDSGAWMFTSNKAVVFSSGWESRHLAKATVKNNSYLYDFASMEFEILWPGVDNILQVIMAPLSVVQKLSPAATRASAGASSDGAVDV
jgi:hypothetical protein